MGTSQDTTPELAAERGADLRAAMCDWYERQGRDLPWRRTSDPYAIWISEAMLQQTRVETVIPYWERFLKRFPAVTDLAVANEEALLVAWSGLGYYRRARSLGAAAAVIVERFGGRFPSELDDALSLPGVGPYTAGAVLSIAYDVSVPVVDGNVLRVFSRWFALEDPAKSPQLARRVWSLARLLVPENARAPITGERDPTASRSGPGPWNQSLMELGATVCTARSPSCQVCPVVRGCEAHARGLTKELPRPSPRPAPLDVELEILVIVRAGRVLLRQRPPQGRMASLWECPTREVAEPGPTRLFDHSHGSPCAGGELVAREALVELRHSITRHRIRAVVRAGEASFPPRQRASAPFAFRPLAGLEELALTGMTRKLLGRREVREYVGGSER